MTDTAETAIIYETLEIDLVERGPATVTWLGKLLGRDRNRYRVDVMGQIRREQGQRTVYLGTFVRKCPWSWSGDALPPPLRRKPKRIIKRTRKMLLKDGWEEMHRGETWFAYRFRRRVGAADGL